MGALVIAGVPTASADEVGALRACAEDPPFNPVLVDPIMFGETDTTWKLVLLDGPFIENSEQTQADEISFNYHVDSRDWKDVLWFERSDNPAVPPEAFCVPVKSALYVYGRLTATMAGGFGSGGTYDCAFSVGYQATYRYYEDPDDLNPWFESPDDYSLTVTPDRSISSGKSNFASALGWASSARSDDCGISIVGLSLDVDDLASYYLDPQDAIVFWDGDGDLETGLTGPESSCNSFDPLTCVADIDISHTGSYFR